jgi:tetratricopeptide (TPR) repeat protein
MRRRLAFSLFALFAASVAIAGRAQDGEAEARTQFQAGLDSARAGQWGSALEAFDRCYRLAPQRASVLFNLAGAQLRTGRLLHAHANYHRLRDRKDSALSASHRRALEKQLQLIEQRIPRLRLVIEGLRPDDRVLLDKTRLYPNELEMELWVDPGEHVLAVYRPNGAQEIRRILLLESQHQYLSFRVP